MAFKGIVFDLNGVLWWDGRLQENAWRLFSHALRGKVLSKREMAAHVHGRCNRYTLEYLLGCPVVDTELENLILRKETLYRSMCLRQGDEFRLSPGATELLNFLANARIPRTVATASGKANVDFFIRHLALDRWFDPGRIVYDDGTLPGKPAPDVYLRAAHTLGLAPATCVAVEDSLAGLESARTAGMGCVAAMGPKKNHGRLLQSGIADIAVETLAELPRERLFTASRSHEPDS